MIMFMLTLTKKTTMIRIIFVQNHDHGEDDEQHLNNETLLGVCEEHHGSSLGSTSFASNADVVRSKENSHLEVSLIMVALVATILYYCKYTIIILCFIQLIMMTPTTSVASPSTQCAAVKTHSSEIKVPPQKY